MVSHCPECGVPKNGQLHKPACSRRFPVEKTQASYSFAAYHESIKSTVLSSYPDFGDNLVYPALGANDEAGELAGKVKKLWRDCGITHYSQVLAHSPVKPEVQELIVGSTKEIGDVLWYLDAMATALGTTLEECARNNVNKLLSRQTRGTTSGSGDDR